MDKDLRDAIRACGITKKGEPLAEVIWKAAGEIFTAAGENAVPFEVAQLVYTMMKCKAADIEMARSRTRNK
jgi:hypothetical protein